MFPPALQAVLSGGLAGGTYGIIASGAPPHWAAPIWVALTVTSILWTLHSIHRDKS